MFSLKNLFIKVICTCLLLNFTQVNASELKNDLISPDNILTATHQTVSYYVPDQVISIQTQIELSSSLTALGMTVTLPQGWTYLETSGVNQSEIDPKVDGCTLTFAWINNLDLNQMTFSYKLKAGPVVGQEVSITANITFRVGASTEKEQNVLPNPLIIKARNVKPYPPDLISPANHETGILLSPTLITESFQDPNENDTHLGSDWQLFIDTNNSQDLIYFIHTENDQVNLPLPEFILMPDSMYTWRVRHFDDNGEVSEWSYGHFETVVNSDLEDGIPVSQKVDNNVDMDNDSVSDNHQTSIKSFQSIVGDVNIGLKSTYPDDCVVSMVRSIDPDQTISDTINRPAKLPFGMIAFKLTVNEPGDSAIVNVFYSQPLPENVRWYMYDFQNGWKSYLPQLSNDRKTVTINLVDGGDGDADGIKNGIIIDPSGPGIPQSQDVTDTPTINETIDNGSCFINVINWK